MTIHEFRIRYQKYSERKNLEAKDSVDLELKLVEIHMQFHAAMKGLKISPKLTEDSKESIDNITDDQREDAAKMMQQLLAVRKEEANGK